MRAKFAENTEVMVVTLAGPTARRGGPGQEEDKASDHVGTLRTLTMLDLDRIENEARSFAKARANATPGKWFRGAWMGFCKKHKSGNHPGLDAAVDPCETTMELMTDGDHANYVSTTDFNLLVGGDDEGPILSRGDAEFIVKAKNTQLDGYILALIAELRELID
jgi:hypothetical protein